MKKFLKTLTLAMLFVIFIAMLLIFFFQNRVDKLQVLEDEAKELKQVSTVLDSLRRYCSDITADSVFNKE